MAEECAGEVARRQRVRAKRLMQSADRWAKGAARERATASALEELPSQWRVLHDVPWPGRPRANIDHIVIGPAGVFVVDSKNWSGPITVRGDMLREGKHSRAGAVASAEEAARAVARLLRLSSHQVEPVICLVRKDKIVATTRRVTVCSTGSIVRLLTSRPRTLSEFHARVLAIELDPHRVGAAAAWHRPRPKRWAARRGSGALVGALAALTVAVTLAVSPQLATDLADRVTRFVADMTERGEGTEPPPHAPAGDQRGVRADVQHDAQDDVRPGRTQTPAATAGRVR